VNIRLVDVRILEWFGRTYPYQFALSTTSLAGFSKFYLIPLVDPTTAVSELRAFVKGSRDSPWKDWGLENEAERRAELTSRGAASDSDTKLQQGVFVFNNINTAA
jgi:hypothetical protein